MQHYNTVNSNGVERGTFDEYEYDALGRRIVVLAHRNASVPACVGITYCITNLCNTTSCASSQMTYESTYHQLLKQMGDVDTLQNFWTNGKLDSTRINHDPATFDSLYDAYARPTAIRDPAGHVTSYSYGGSGTLRNTATATSATNITSYAYDAFGRVNVVTLPNGATQTRLYDRLNRDTMDIGTIDASTPLWRTGLFMAVLGLGLGATMQNLVLAVQNNAAQADIGAASAVVTS